MKRFVSILAIPGSVLVAAFALVAPTLCAHAADPGGDQGEARRERKAGNILSIRQIEQLVLPRMGGMQYLGPDYDPAAMAYRLKFIQNGKVYFVDVDARTGRVIGQSR
ncbi:PepSY domain-containing protein [Novosphingobium sp. BL-8H]|uniref:PepSY domain-containing protein n=1 Tax=Novosphingobium sp. BL-8H TaxID=3127640 RepID=UPI003756F823